MRLPELYSYGKEEVFLVCGWAAAVHEDHKTQIQIAENQSPLKNQTGSSFLKELAQLDLEEWATICYFFTFLEMLELLRKQVIAKRNVAFEIRMDGQLGKIKRKMGEA